MQWRSCTEVSGTARAGNRRFSPCFTIEKGYWVKFYHSKISTESAQNEYLREPDPQRTINRPFGPRRMDVRTRGARVAQRLVALLETSFCPSPRGRARRADGDIALSPCLPPASAGRELLFVSRHTFGHIDDATASQLLFDSMINR